MGKAVLILLPLALFGVAFGLNDAPNIRILEIRRDSQSTREVGEHVVNKPANSYVIVGEDIQSNSKVIFECDAHYPVQWVYTGSGMPEYFTNTSSGPAVTRPGSDLMISHTRPGPSFTASLSLGVDRNIGPQDSGKYICRSFQTPELNSFYYLHDKEAKIFTQPGGTEIYYKRTDRSVLIPCSASIPDATVSLQKSVNGLVSCPLNESIKYDPSRGFDLKISNYFDPAGVYVCTAGFKDTFQVTRYTLTPTSEPIPSPLEENKKECLGNQDCTSDKACMRINNRQQCTSPCPHVCGRNTRCETINNVPRCYCLPEHVGDPYQTCSPQAPQPSTQDPCSPNPCGHNTRCDRYGSRYTCSCLAGYQGDPYVRCYQARDACSPNPCGANTDCVYKNGYATCICRPGYYGTPPNCRAECEQDHHCAYDRACMRNKCQNPCVGACDHLPGTRCHVVRRIAVCSRIQTRCQDGYYGRDCQSIYTKDLASASVPRPLTVSASNDMIDGAESTSPCSPSPCGSKAECLIKDFQNTHLNVTSQIAYCQCVPNYTGNADIECYPVEEQLSPPEVPDLIDLARDTDKNATQSSGNSTVAAGNEPERPVEPVEPKTCGINAISIISDGVSSCSCPEGFTGIATIECHQITNNADDENGINGTNVNACNPNPCGRNTNCILNAEGVASCECIRPFEGNPWVGCELNCTKNEECPKTQVCNEPSQRCVNPCDPESQPFFTQCGRNAACKVEDHTAYCFCPEEFPHGSPHIHCKEEAWMPNHLKYNSTCENSKKLKCGNNSSCKRFHDTNEYCVCLPGFFGDPYVDDGCKLGLQCAKNDHCKDTEECMNGKCLDVCRNKETCGKPNEGCIGKNHTTSCVCHIGTILNPKGECEPMMGALAERLLFFRSFEDI